MDFGDFKDGLGENLEGKEGFGVGSDRKIVG